MTPERWLQVERIYQEAEGRPRGERASFLDQACGGDADLREEVERMLAGDSAAAGFLETPAVEMAARALAAEAVRISPGSRLGPYEVVSFAGAGGMGEVYKARDTRLHRTVAIKVLPPLAAGDAERRRRFLREARAASALNHPNIVTLYDVVSEDGRDSIVMEYVEGKTLADRIGRKGLLLRDALHYAIQIADALAAAHAAGIVHRDVKPGNILVTEKGSVKVLDFGLAKLAGQEGVPASTQTASLAGTPGYLAPEQIEGKAAGTRSDIFAFGCILYELLSGRRAFPGETITAALTATATTEPKPLEGVPERLDELVRRCLRKAPARRLQHMDDVKVELEELRQAGGGAATFAPHTSRKLWRIAIPVLLAAVLVAGGLYYRSHQAKPLTDKDSIVLSDFTNTTGDSVFDDTLKQGLAVQLEQSPFLKLVSERRVNETLKLMRRPAGDRLTPEVTREVCQRTSTKAMLAGSIAGLGSQYVIGLKAVNCNTGEVLAEAQEQAVGKEAVLKALDAAAVSLRSKLGESLSSVEKYATPVAEATTPSLEALKAYSL